MQHPSSLLSPQQHAAPIQPVGQRRRQVIASLLGEPSFEAIDWRRLMQDGVLIRLHIGHCGFTTKLELGDLGVQVEDDDVREKLSRWMVLGAKRLLPQASMKTLTRIESKARYALKERSFRTELGAFVPSSAYVAWRETTEVLRREYFAFRDHLLAHYRTLVQEVLAEYEVIARDTYQRLRRTHPDLLTESEARFITAYGNRIADAIPTPERIRETFEFRYELVDGLSQIGPSPDQTTTAVPDQERQEMHAEPEGVPSSLDAMRTQVQERAWAREMMQRDLRQHAQERVAAALDSYLTSVVGHLRSLTYEAMYDMLTTLQRSGDHFSARSVAQLNHLLAQFRTLNFYGDTELEQMMDRLAQIVELSPADRTHHLADIERIGRAILTVTRSTLLDLDQEPRSARDLALPDFPTERMVRQARAELGLEGDDALVALQVQPLVDLRAARAEHAWPEMESLWREEELEPSRAGREL